MIGALANGFSQVGDPNTIAYLDEKQYWPFWEVCDKLDVPFYLHPRNPLPQDARIYQDHGWLLGPTWAFGQETAVHALRLMGSGLFDKLSEARRSSSATWARACRSACGASTTATPGFRTGTTIRRRRRSREYFQNNFHITTSGNFHTPALLNAMMVVGADRIMFSTDWPFENIDHAAVWFDAATDQRGGPDQDRADQRVETVQAAAALTRQRASFYRRRPRLYCRGRGAPAHFSAGRPELIVNA